MLTDATVEQCLGTLLVGQVDYGRQVSCQGIVTRRRRHETATFLMVQLDAVQVQVVLPTPTAEAAAMDGGSAHLLPIGLGCTVWCTGHPGCDREGSLSLYAQELKLVKVGADAKQIANLLDALADGIAQGVEVAAALSCSDERLQELLRLRADATEATAYKKALRFQALVVQAGGETAAGALQAAPSTRQRKARVTKAEMEALERAEALAPNPLLDSWQEESHVQDIRPVLGEAEPLLDIDPSLPSARGPQTRGEYFHGRKWPQVRWFLKRLAALRAEGHEFRHVLDVGGGRGDLAVNIAAHFAHLGTRVTVVDMNGASLQAGRGAAQRAGVDVEFRCMDFAEISAQDALPDVDFVVALHACGGLSDAALSFAARRKIPFMVCPCCHLKHTELEPPDGWASLCEAAPVLRQLAERDSCSASARALRTIASLRICAMQRLRLPLQLMLATFPEDYSLRNLVIIGAPQG